MNNTLEIMIRRYEAKDVNSVENAVKQCLQEVVLSGLSRSDFFSRAAFNGGTALRIFHGLPRFSEDLDFSVDPDRVSDFTMTEYKGFVDDEAGSLGIQAELEIDNDDAVVQRAYLRGNCRSILASFGCDEELIRLVPGNKVIKVKIEADTSPIYGAASETKYLLQPYPSAVRLYDKGSLFAGKTAAVLQRSWRSRFKGRDLYDFVFYISEKYPINMEHLRNRLIYGGTLPPDQILDKEQLVDMLSRRFQEIDYDSARNDVIPFIKDSRSVDIWNAEFFTTITRSIAE